WKRFYVLRSRCSNKRKYFIVANYEELYAYNGLKKNGLVFATFLFRNSDTTARSADARQRHHFKIFPEY
ncbi:hypothetical protein L9F63_015053, partial [Diploptera punctata]